MSKDIDKIEMSKIKQGENHRLKKMPRMKFEFSIQIGFFQFQKFSSFDELFLCDESYRANFEKLTHIKIILDFNRFKAKNGFKL